MVSVGNDPLKIKSVPSRSRTVGSTPVGTGVQGFGTAGLQVPLSAETLAPFTSTVRTTSMGIIASSSRTSPLQNFIVAPEPEPLLPPVGPEPPVGGTPPVPPV